MLLRIFLVVTLLVAANSLCRAQLSSAAPIQKPPISLATPTASSLGLFGEVPVSLYTGLPQINIPLYTVKEGGIVVPISLGYHASGFRPDVHPGWVGMNWALSAGGFISRKINMLEDDYSNVMFRGYYHNYDALDDDDWSTANFMTSRAGGSDMAPDEFFFSFLGYSGKFYLDENQNWKVQSNKTIKVTFDGVFLDPPLYAKRPGSSIYEIGSNFSFPDTFGGFTLTTEDGTQYVFGGTTDAIEYSVNFFSSAKDRWKATSWYLTKIISNDSIQF